MICAIMQPTYLPWAGYFDLIDRVDVFVFLDDVKVSKQTWGVRNRIKTAQGELYLTVPLKKYRDHKERFFTNTEIAYERDWNAKHLKTIRQAYSKAKHFKQVFWDLEALLNAGISVIGDLNIAIIRLFSEKCGIQSEFVRSSELAGTSGIKDGRLVAICQKLGADCYLSPPGSAVYLEKDDPGGAFSTSDVKLYYHNFTHPVYPQIGHDFLSHMAIIDLLMNCGYDEACRIIRSGRREMIHYLEFRKTMSEGGHHSTESQSCV